jgi:two-component system chemotaxis response regulator CheY
MLIVEDEFLSRQLLSMYLEGYGRYDIAVNGQEAVNAVMSSYETKSPYDIVFMDIMLPDKDGLTALKEIREYESSHEIFGSATCKIIMMTALSDAGTVMESFKNQCEGYVTKPYSKEMVDETIAKLDFE